MSFSHQCGVTGVVSTVHRAGADADLEARGCRKQSQLAVHVAARGALLQSTRSLAIIASWLCQTMNLTPVYTVIIHIAPKVRYGGSVTNLSEGGIWLSARLEPLCYNRAQSDSQNPTATACGRNSTTGERLVGWNVASAALPLGALNASEM